MSRRWAVRLDAERRDAVARLRLEPEIESLELPDALWLRGPSSDEQLDLKLCRRPGAVRFDILADGQLLPVGKRLPSGRLPEGKWIALKAWAQVTLPVAMLAAQSLRRVPFSLERASTHEEADLLLARQMDWAAYAMSAPQVRLEKLTFAASSDGRVVIRGRPLPPVPGARYYEQAGVAVPCGWGWPAWLEASVVREALAVEPEALALFSAAGTWEAIAGDQFVRATRSAVRLSVPEPE